jgi:Flp pilus assembly protein TadG
MGWAMIKSVHRGRRLRERGAVAVEMALVLPLLVMLLLGTVTAGIAYSNSIGLTNAVREGARFGATTESGSSWADDVISRTRATQFDDNGTPKATVVCAQLRKAGTATPVHTAGDCTGARTPETSPAGFNVGDCFVWVAGSRPFKITILVGPNLGGDIDRHSVARYERTCV